MPKAPATERIPVISFIAACLAAAMLFFASGCSRLGVMDDLSDASFELVNQDGTEVTFPGDFRGEILVAGYIYTQCPDICSIITANMNNIYHRLEDRSGVHFVGITFDPRRDTPPVLKDYMNNFSLDEEKFTFLTGDSATIDRLMKRMDIRLQISYPDTSQEGNGQYLINHSDRITLIDARSRVRQDYGGSMVPPEHVIEDINKLR